MANNKKELIAAFKEFAVLLELTGANAFKCRAYDNAARVLEGIDGTPAQWIESGSLEGVKGIGKGVFEKIEEWVESGRIEEIDSLRGEVPAGLLDMLKIPGLGAKKIKLIWENLGLTSLAELEAAAGDGRLNDLPRFSQKTSDNILKGIAQRRQYSERHRLDVAQQVADIFYERLTAHPDVKRIEIAGSMRRGRETIKDLDFLVASTAPANVMEAFTTTPGVIDVVNHGETKSSILFEGGVPVDLRVVEDSAYPAALNYFTGSKEHNTALRGRAKQMGLRLNEYGLYPEDDLENSVPLKEEADIYAKLGLKYIEPELRENLGEIEAAGQDNLPALIEPGDMVGMLHCHTTWSDGANTLEEMALACKDLGYKYFCVCDHSQTAAYARGLQPDRLKRQWDEIEKLNGKLKGVTILRGIESDILADGSLDYDDEILDQLDVVVASIHSQMTMPGDEMTRRITRALSHPATTILGHPTARLLLRREPVQVDLQAVFETAAKHDVAIEINASPYRLDLDWRHIRGALKAGCRFAINPDSHAVEGLTEVRYGIRIARKGWLGPQNVINTLSLADFHKWLKSRRK